MSSAPPVTTSFRVLWTGTNDTLALDRLVSLVDGLDSSTLGLPTALHAGGDRIVGLSVRPCDAIEALGYPVEVQPSVVTMPAQSTANERLLIGSADAVILTDGGLHVDDATASQKLEDILDSLIARGRRPSTTPVFIDRPDSSNRSRAFWMKEGARWGCGLHVVDSPESSPTVVFDSCWNVLRDAAVRTEIMPDVAPMPPLESALIHRLHPATPSWFQRLWNWLTRTGS